MAFYLAALGGAGSQFFGNGNTPLAGGKIYTYLAGTTTNVATYTTSVGNIARPNPIVLDSTGRVPDGGEIWVSDANEYKFIIKTSADVLIGTYDNLYGLAKPTTYPFYTSPYSGLAFGLNPAIAGGYVDVVRDFLAIGDGITNDTAACQAALNTGKKVVFPANKVFAINAMLITKANDQVIQIDGQIKAIASMSAVIKSIGFDRVKVIGTGVIECNNLASAGVHFSANKPSVVGVECADILVNNAAGPYSGFTGAVLFDSVGGQAGGNRHKDISVRRTKIRSGADHGILVAYADGVSVTENLIDVVGFHGHESVNSTDVVMTGNVVQSANLSGLGVGTSCSNWIISNNTIRNCGGDGSITSEHNSINGVISNNTILECRTQGINVSYGTPAAAPFEKIRNITVDNNVMFFKTGGATADKIGINVYSSTTPGVGEGINVTNNTIVGFNIGITYAYCEYGEIDENNILNLAGANSAPIIATMVNRVSISGNKCNTDSSNHSIQLLSYIGISSDNCTISNNTMLASGSATKSLVYIDGTGNHTVTGNRTSGAKNYIECSGAATVLADNNTGNLASTPFSGGTINALIGSTTATTVGAAGAASALPANPLGYVIGFVNGVGRVKVPYYNL